MRKIKKIVCFFFFIFLLIFLFAITGIQKAEFMENQSVLEITENILSFGNRTATSQAIVLIWMLLLVYMILGALRGDRFSKLVVIPSAIFFPIAAYLTKGGYFLPNAYAYPFFLLLFYGFFIFLVIAVFRVFFSVSQKKKNNEKRRVGLRHSRNPIPSKKI